MMRIFCDEWQLLSGKSENVPGQWKDDGAIFRCDQMWERECFPGIFMGSVIPRPGGVFRFYYFICAKTGTYAPNLAIGELMPDGSWHKEICNVNSPGVFSLTGLPDKAHPVQANVFELAPGEWRMYFWVHAPGLCRMLMAQSNDGWQWHCSATPVLYHWNNDAAAKAYQVPPELRVNDATSLIRLPEGSWELYSAGCFTVPPDHRRFCPEDGANGAVRFILRLTSPDGVEWGDTRMVLWPDAAESAELQFYYLNTFAAGARRFGVAGRYRACHQDMGLEHVFSDDGIHWQRPLACECLPRQRDDIRFGLYPCANFIRENGKLVMYYSGDNYSHNGLHVVPGCQPETIIGRAAIDEGKFLGRKLENARLWSPPLSLFGTDIKLHWEGEEPQLEWTDVLDGTFLGNADMDAASRIRIPVQLQNRYARLRLHGSGTLFDLEVG